MFAYRMFGSLDGEPVPHMHKTRQPFALDAWNEAEVKWTHNPGSKNQTHYWSGFHVFQDLATAREYARKFKREAWLTEVEVEDTWTKPTNGDVTIARHLKVSEVQWARAERVGPDA
jgi:hypothetical protein